MNTKLAFGVLCLLIANGPAQSEVLKVGGTGAALGLLQKLSGAFSDVHPGDKVHVVDGLGSSGAILATADGALQFAISGRPLKPEEKAKGLEGAAFIETPFLFVSSHPKRQKLTKVDVLGIYDGTLAKWPDGLPIKPVLRPKSDAATAFLVSSFEGMEPAMDKLRARPEVPVAATDQDNTATAEKIANSFTGITLLQLLTEKPRLQAVMLDGVNPSVETMANGSYPLKMTMYAVTTSRPSPIAQRFAQFLRSAEVEKIVRDNGGVVVPPAATSSQ